MMDGIYQNICKAARTGEKQLAVLIDPDKFKIYNTKSFTEKVNQSVANYIFVGGSTVNENITDILIAEIKKYTQLSVVLFPGNICQITEKADGLLFLSLISGRNSEYLIGKHVEAISTLRKTELEVISTGYVLIENGKETSVQKVTKTNPLPRSKVSEIIDTAKAGELLGMKLIYLEAGSGAQHPITAEIIKSVKDELKIPLIVGGGIRNLKQLKTAYRAGADLVVIGTAFEDNEAFFDELKLIT